MKWLKEKWEWLSAGLFVLIGILAVFSTRKTKNDVDEKSAENQRDTERKIAEKQKDLTDNFLEEKDKLGKDRDNIPEEVNSIIGKEREKIKDNPDLIDDHLKDLGLTKK